VYIEKGNQVGNSSDEVTERITKQATNNNACIISRTKEIRKIHGASFSLAAVSKFEEDDDDDDDGDDEYNFKTTKKTYRRASREKRRPLRVSNSSPT
jgi:hypothetical protein